MPTPPGSTTERELLIDAARASSVCAVVLFHAGLWRVQRTATGWSARTMELGPIGWYGSWLVMVMPLFFVAGGFAPPVTRTMGLLNALLMTIYLWHMPCVVIAFGIGIGLGTAIASLAGVFTFPLFTLGLALALMAVVVPLVARLDAALVPPLGERQNGPVAVLAMLLLTASLAAVWRHGLVVHPAQPRSSLGVLGTWLGSAMLAWVARRPAPA